MIFNPRETLENQLYRFGLFGLVAFYLFASAGQAVNILYYWYDGGLYVSRAYELLMGNAFGPYTDGALMKLPAISFLLAGLRRMGIPYIVFFKVAYVLSVLYLLFACRKIKLRPYLRLLIAAIWFFHPFIYSTLPTAVLRETLEIPFIFCMVASLFVLFEQIQSSRTVNHPHLMLFAASFAFLVNLREEGIVLFSLLFFSASFLYFLLSGHTTLKRIRLVSVYVLIPSLFAVGIQMGTRIYVNHHYGFALTNDFGEGEFPKFAASLRSIKKKRDNRFIMFSMEGLRQASEYAPEIKLILQQMDRFQLPGKQSQSCTVLGLCGELAATESLETLRMAAYRAGLTPTLEKAQHLYHRMSVQIDEACSKGQLDCERNGEGLMPPFELKWSRAFVSNFIRNSKNLFEVSYPGFQAPPDHYKVDPRAMRIWQSVTMSHHADTQASEKYFLENKWSKHSKQTKEKLEFWLQNPKSAEFGEQPPAVLSVDESTLALDDPNRSVELIKFKTPSIVEGSNSFYSFLFAALFFMFILLFPQWIQGRSLSQLPSYMTVCLSLLFYVFVRTVALSYVNIFLIVQNRLFFGVNMMLFSALLIANTALMAQFMIPITKLIFSKGKEPDELVKQA